jgi:hypothetical protein
VSTERQAPDIPAEQIGAPTTELGANGRVGQHIRQAVDSLATKPGHDPVTGRFVALNVEAGKTFAGSSVQWAALEPAKRELVEAVMADRGASDADPLPTTFAGLVDAFAEVSLFRRSMFIRLTDFGGPITTKGKARALYTAYLAALDRELKLATTIGLERRSRRVTPMQAIAAEPEVRA